MMYTRGERKRDFQSTSGRLKSPVIQDSKHAISQDFWPGVGG